MQKFAGVLFFLAGTIILLGILTAEIFYPTQYSISQNMISNLGATSPPDSIIRQPSAMIFDTAIIVGGLLILVGAYVFFIIGVQQYISFAIGLLGIGAAGVGIFPAFHIEIHPLVALVAFSAGSIAAIVSSRIIKGPFAIFALLLGIIAALFLFLGILFPKSIVPFLGRGGTERWVFYPLILWLVGFGGYLMNSGKNSFVSSQKRGTSR